MKEVEKKDLPGVTGGQVGQTNVAIIQPITLPPTIPQPGPVEPNDPFGDGKPRQVEA
jgi:hypothetical protein